MDIPRMTTARHHRQAIERAQFMVCITDWLTDSGLYTFEGTEPLAAIAERLTYLNLDEGGELMEVDADKYMKEYIREMLEE